MRSGRGDAASAADNAAGVVNNRAFGKLSISQAYTQLDVVVFTLQSRGVDAIRALDQIEEIHRQIAKGEVYRGYRSVPVALSGLMGLGAAWLQPAALGTTDPAGFVFYWTVIAVVAAFIGSGEIIYNYLVHEDASGRRQTRMVVGQFMPSVVGGAGMTICLTHLGAELVALLPGLWAICFGTGVFASRPYLPRASGWVALFFYVAGFALLWIARGPQPLTAWWVGGTFGLGQLLAAAVLWWNLERN